MGDKKTITKIQVIAPNEPLPVLRSNSPVEKSMAKKIEEGGRPFWFWKSKTDDNTEYARLQSKLVEQMAELVRKCVDLRRAEGRYEDIDNILADDKTQRELEREHNANLKERGRAYDIVKAKTKILLAETEMEVARLNLSRADAPEDDSEPDEPVKSELKKAQENWNNGTEDLVFSKSNMRIKIINLIADKIKELKTGEKYANFTEDDIEAEITNLKLTKEELLIEVEKFEAKRE